MGKGQSFNKWYRENWIATWKTMKLDPYLTPHKKINSKWIKGLNVRVKTIKLLEDKIEGNLDIGFSNDFLDVTTRSQETK